MYLLQSCELTRVDIPDIINVNEWRIFWISFDNITGEFQVGRNNDPVPFMSATDASPIDVQYLGFRLDVSPGPDHEARFRFCTEGIKLE